MKRDHQGPVSPILMELLNPLLWVQNATQTGKKTFLTVCNDRSAVIIPKNEKQGKRKGGREGGSEESEPSELAEEPNQRKGSEGGKV